MLLRYGNNKAFIENEVLQLYTGKTLVYEKKISDFLWHSSCYPWEYQSYDWILVKTKESEDEISFLYECMPIQVGILFYIEQEELKISVEYKNIGNENIKQFTAGLTFLVCENSKNKVTIPHLIYNDNPSADPERTVPHIGDIPGRGTIVEEHRLPIPAVNIEWKDEDAHSYLTLLSLPEVKEGYEDEYWSLGVIKESEGERIMSLSGPLMFNGMKDVMYGGRCTPISYMKGYRSLQPKEVLKKTYYLSWGQMLEEGKGFRNIIDIGYRILQPKTQAQHTHKEVINYKKNVLDSRFYQDDKSIGYLTFGSANKFGNISGRPEYFLYGWTGQCIKLSWCECMLGLKTEERFRLERGMKIADFFVKNGQGEIDGLYRGYYVIEEDSWRGEWQNPKTGIPSRIQGESFSDLIDLMLLLREHQVPVPLEWENAVKKVCNFLMDGKYQTKNGLYPLEWEQDGKVLNHDSNAAGMSCVVTLVKAYEYFHKIEYLEYAKEKYEIYAKIHMENFDIPFARATMDAKCEDKEAGIYFFVAAAKLYEATRMERFKTWGEIAADWILTFVFFWETGFQPGTICDLKSFKTTGWPGVSVQNHHLDVFFPTYELYDFGKLCNDTKFMNMAKHISNAMTHGISTKEGEWGYSVIGEQGEHYYNTNYFQLLYPNILNHLKSYRGGMQVWNPSWITAQVMSSALKFHYIEERD